MLAFRALPLVLVVSALSALLFHWRILPMVVRAFGWLLEKTLGLGGPVGLSTAANVFVLIVDPKASRDGHGEEPGADIALFLSRHGVKVTVQRETATATDVGGLILSRAADLDVAWQRQRVALARLFDEDLAKFNALFREANIPAVIVPKKRSPTPRVIP